MLLIAGFPAVIGTLIGGFAFSPLLGVLFLGIGIGAIWQVVYEVSLLLQRFAEELKLNRCPKVQLVHARIPPLVWSIGIRPRILLPQQLFASLDRAST